MAPCQGAPPRHPPLVLVFCYQEDSKTRSLLFSQNGKASHVFLWSTFQFLEVYISIRLIIALEHIPSTTSRIQISAIHAGDELHLPCSLHPDHSFSISEMALEKDLLSNNQTAPPAMDSVPSVKKTDSGSNVDSEKGHHPAAAHDQGKKNGRIAPVLPHLRGYDFGSDDSSDDADAVLGKQIELEANNAIQYRTCSWQKVCCVNVSLGSLFWNSMGRGEVERTCSVEIYLSWPSDCSRAQATSMSPVPHNLVLSYVLNRTWWEQPKAPPNGCHAHFRWPLFSTR